MSQPRRGIDWAVAKASSVQKSPIQSFLSTKGISFQRIIALFIGGLACSTSVFILYRAFAGGLEFRTERSILVTLIFIFAFLWFPLGRKRWDSKPNIFFGIDLLFILITIAVELYVLYGVFIQDTRWLTVRIFSTEFYLDLIPGAIVVFLTLEITRRVLGWLVILPLVFGFYAAYGYLLPAPFTGPRLSLIYLLQLLFAQTSEGVYGTGTYVLLSFVYLFLLFGSIMKNTGVAAAFVAISNALMGHTTGGPAKVSVMSSALVGTVSGSPIANVVLTGVMTIPAMKSVGYAPKYAAAVESCASSVSQLMPPIMGVSAFLMAVFIRVSYFEIALGAAIPALLFVLSTFISVHMRAKALGLKTMPKNECPFIGRVLMEGGHLFIPLITIIGMVVAKYSEIRAIIIGIVASFLLSFLRKETRLKPLGIITTLEDTLISSPVVVTSCVLVSLIIGLLNVSGVGLKMSLLVETLAGGNLFVGLVIAAIVSAVLGMGMPTMLVYITMALFAAPALVHMGATPFGAHLFTFFFGVMAGITPPICLTAYTAAGIAGTKPMETGFAACRLGFVAYLIPFMFIYEPSLATLGGFGAASIQRTLFAIFGAILSVCSFSIASEGWFLRKPNIYERILMVAAGVCLIFPQLFIKLAGIALFGLVTISQKFVSEKG